MNILRNFFPIVVVTLLILFICGSFYRFIVLHDYVVAFEGPCDPDTQSCYVGCEDDTCSSEYYYSIIERRADELVELCGPNILECEAAYSCSTADLYCAVTYCDREVDGDACTFFSQ